MAKGFRGHRRRSYRGAHEGVLHALSHAYVGRKQKKRTMRRLWITRLNAALRERGHTYRAFIQKLTNSSIELDRKILSQIAMQDPKTFDKIVKEVMA
jgi:large subunit ribosomal protein L20